jgi:ABC-2 type transport system permease protein
VPTELVVVPGVVPAGRTTTVIARRTARRAVRSGVLWGYVFAVYVASTALTFASTYKTAAQRERLAALYGSNAAVSALVGPPHQIQTVAGFTVWKCLTTLAIVGAVWGALTGTRLLRGEEEAGRWELMLSGRTTRRGATAQALAGLGAGFVALWAVTALVTAVVGRSSTVAIGVGPALFFALATVSGAAVFLAVGALTSQLVPTRRQASAYAGAALGVSYALRMVADSGAGLGWLRWASPLGWIEELQPLTSPHPDALLPVVVLTAGLAGLAVHLAGRRDVGASTFPDRPAARPHTALLNGPAGLALRLSRPTLLGWGAAVAAMGLLSGVVAKSAGRALSASTSVEKVISRLGGSGSGSDAYLGVAFLITAVLVAFVAAGQVGAARSEESGGRLDALMARPVRRWSWLGGRLGLATGAVVATGLVAAVAVWLGALSQHSQVRFVGLIGGGLNTVPPALCVLGIGVLVLGVWPRATVMATYGVIAWSFLVEIVGGTVNANHWLLDTSVFHQMAAAPAVAPDWASAGALVALGALGAAVGTFAFSRRDLVGE